MPKTASKRAQARRAARIQRAHEEAPQSAVVRRVPMAQRRAKARRSTLIKNYPWATTIFVALLLGLGVVFMKGQHVGPFAVAKSTPEPQATCDLKTHLCNKAPLMTIDKSKTYTATIKTARGDIVIQLNAKNAPLAVNNFVFLADQHYYDGTYFWRVEQPDKPSVLDQSGQPSMLSLIQGGTVSADPLKDSAENSRPGYTFKDDPVVGDYTAGTMAMANRGANTNGAQFFICTGDNSTLPKNFDIFGTVTSGLDVAKAIQPGDKIVSVTITVK